MEQRLTIRQVVSGHRKYDICTKPLARHKFAEKCRMLGLNNVDIERGPRPYPGHSGIDRYASLGEFDKLPHVHMDPVV